VYLWVRTDYIYFSISIIYALWHLSWLQASAAMLMSSTLFRGIIQRRIFVLYRGFGTTCRSHLQGSRTQKKIGCVDGIAGNGLGCFGPCKAGGGRASWWTLLPWVEVFRISGRDESSLNFRSDVDEICTLLGPKSCPETSVKDYQSTVRNTPKESRFCHIVYVGWCLWLLCYRVQILSYYRSCDTADKSDS
jgi:hypothetical protein